MPSSEPSTNQTSKKSYTYYHAGPLFSLSDLHTNTLLSSLIHKISHESPTSSTFIPLVPQNIEARDTSPHSIRDQDIRALLSCDLALFTFDGTELDSGRANRGSCVLRSSIRRRGVAAHALLDVHRHRLLFGCEMSQLPVDACERLSIGAVPLEHRG